MKLKGSSSAEVNGITFSPNLSTLFIASLDESDVEGVGGNGCDGYKKNDFYKKSVVVDNTRIARRHFSR